MIAGGVRFVAARHEGGAAVMADAYARTSGRLGVLSVHQGPGVTNALTGITEAAKSRTPMVVLAPDTGAAGARSNFRLDQASLAAGIGAVYERVATPDGAVDDVVRAVRRARAERRTVILGLPLDVQAAECAAPAPRPLPADPVVEAAPARTPLAGTPPAMRSPSCRRRVARCWPPRPWRKGCSPGIRGTSTCRAVSPHRWPPSSSPPPISWSPGAAR